AQPLDIRNARTCAPAVAETRSAKRNKNSVRRFIRDPPLGSLPGQSYRSCPRGAITTTRRQVQPSGNVVLPPVILVWLLTYSCVSKQGKAEPTSLRASCCVLRCATWPTPPALASVSLR